ncbi:uncharacterized protein [Solanum lycopersicum]|uniref:uncharacterized protein n=1 Tax=Solanum lycopersicum TaxID=4081 RepID=UPI0002BCAA5E|nr:uncharacterized protein LOC101247607 [Solanum lycopersicum]
MNPPVYFGSRTNKDSQKFVDEVHKILCALGVNEEEKAELAAYHLKDVAHGVEVDPKKIESLKNWLRPLTPTDIWSFLGLVNYYRRFVEGFSAIAAPLKTLLKKKAKFEWYETCEKISKTDSLQAQLFSHCRGVVKGKDNVVADALSLLSMGSVSHIDDEKKELVKEVHQLARLGVRLVDTPSAGVSVHSSSESSGVVDVKDKQHLDPVLIELKDLVLNSHGSSYHSSIGMRPFESLYGRRFRSTVGWFEVGEFSILGPEIIHEAMEKLRMIRDRLATAYNCQKSYADNR